MKRGARNDSEIKTNSAKSRVNDRNDAGPQRCFALTGLTTCITTIVQITFQRQNQKSTSRRAQTDIAIQLSRAEAFIRLLSVIYINEAFSGVPQYVLGQRYVIRQAHSSVQA
jgi:hypothetical protein